MKTPETLKMEAFFHKALQEMDRRTERRVNQMVGCTFVACSHEESTVTLAFPIEEWMLNPVHILHGGVMSTFMDIAMGALSICVSPEHQSATAQLEVHFLKAVHLGDTVQVTARCHHTGRTMAQLTAVAASVNTGREVATASAVFSTSFVGLERYNFHE